MQHIRIALKWSLEMKQNKIKSKSEVEKEAKDKLLGQVSYLVAHRISGPIATMLGLIELIKVNICDKDEICPLVDHLKESINELEKNCKELGDLVAAVLTSSLIQNIRDFRQSIQNQE